MNHRGSQEVFLKNSRLTLVSLILVGLTAFTPLFHRPVQAQTTCGEPFLSVSPALTDLGPAEYIRLVDGATGYFGGLYPAGSNIRPPAHEAAGIGIAQQIVPLDAQGDPDPVNGKIAMISVGMSNTWMEFAEFITAAENDSNTNPQLRIINGAQAGQVSSYWTDPNAPTWDFVDQRLANAGLTPAQVQIAWVKQTLTGPGDFPEKAETLQADLELIAQNLLIRYPNIRIAFYSSRTRSYLYWNGLSPEPIAYETGFNVKWMVEKQISGDPSLNYDPANGPVVAPYLSWGPYLWADGINPRGDGFTWLPQDLIADCTHPSPSGTQKIAGLLMAFFQSDSVSTGWFLDDPAITPTVPPTPTATATIELSETPIPEGTPSATPPAGPSLTPSLSPTPTHGFTPPPGLSKQLHLPIIGKDFSLYAEASVLLDEASADPWLQATSALVKFFTFLLFSSGFGLVVIARRRP
jgi:hypothetical protein